MSLVILQQAPTMQKPRSTNDVGGGKSLEQSLSGESRNHMQHSVQDLLLFDPACVHGFRDSNKGQNICFALTFFIANSLHLRCPNLRGAAMQVLKYSLFPSQKHPSVLPPASQGTSSVHLSGLGCT